MSSELKIVKFLNFTNKGPFTNDLLFLKIE